MNPLSHDSIHMNARVCIVQVHLLYLLCLHIIHTHRSLNVLPVAKFRMLHHILANFMHPITSLTGIFVSTLETNAYQFTDMSFSTVLSIFECNIKLLIIANKTKRMFTKTELLKYVLQSIDKDPCILDRINGKESEVNIAFKNGEHRRERHISELIGISFKGTDKYARQARNRVHKIREYVMKHPEFGNREDIETSMRMYYVQAEEVKKMNLNYTDSCVHMDAIMRQRFIRNYFEKNGYCTAWMVLESSGCTGYCFRGIFCCRRRTASRKNRRR